MTSTTEASAPAGAPLADTLDAATLRRVFGDAPEQLDVPRDVKSLFVARVQRSSAAARFIIAGGWVVSLLVGLALISQQALSGGGLLMLVSTGIIIGILGWQYHRASKEFWTAYATARGLTLMEDAHLAAAVPLFSRGDKRTWPRMLSGTIDGRPAKLGLYTYTDVTTDSDGDRQETDYDFTVLCFELPPEVAARFRGIYCRPHTFSFGALQDKLGHDRGVELESSEFRDRYTLRVVDDQDDIAVRELFSPPFMLLLATQVRVYWEQRGSDLVFFQKGHENAAADLDRSCLEAWHVLQRYLEEDR